jgi:hypothetical protein
VWILHGAHCHVRTAIAIASASLRRQRAEKSKERDGGKDDGVDHERNSDKPPARSSGAQLKEELTPGFCRARGATQESP